jgi:hypothetical protein
LRTALERKSLDGDLPLKAGVPGTINLTHAAGAQSLENLVSSEERTR